MLFYGLTITVSAISDFWKRDQFDVVKGMVREGKMHWDGFISIVLYSSSMFFRNVLLGCVQFVQCTVNTKTLVISCCSLCF